MIISIKAISKNLPTILVSCSLLLLVSWQSSIDPVVNRNDFNRVINERREIQRQFKDSAVYLLPSTYLESFKNANSWAQAAGTEREKQQAYFNLLFYYYNHQDSDKVIEIANQLLSEPSFMEVPESVSTLEALNYSYNRIGFYNKQLEVLPLFIEQNKKFGYQVLSRDFKDYHDRAMIYYKLKQYAKARENFELQAAAFQENGKTFRYASMLNNIALTYEGQGDYDKALETYYQALEALSSSGADDYFTTEYQQHFTNVVQSNIASIRLRQGDIEQAGKTFLREISSSKQVGEPRITTQAYINMGEWYLLNSQARLASTYIDSAIALEKEFKNPVARAKAFAMKAKVLHTISDAKDAYKYDLFAQGITDSLSRISAQLLLEEAALKYDFVKARKEVDEARALLKEKNKLEWLQWIIVGISIILVVTFIFLYLKSRKARRLSEAQSELMSKAAHEKELMLYEIHHRIKNNLQTVSGILDLKTSNVEDAHFRKVIDESQQLIQTMNLVHDQLYQYGEDTVVDMQTHFEKICKGIIDQFDAQVSLHVSARDAVVHSADATPLGLILCELVTNSLKHGLKNEKKGIITVLLKKEHENWYFKYKDNGSGLEAVESNEDGKVGLQLITLLVDELGGTWESSNNNGFIFQMNF
ncbi:tetratricopeptide repeat-containing sensor histidine kinase [Nonlabens ponticola]|uniref:histidine kinase n=1 Tax=Nonlabens ponticola TaxID=2496866 RepID=A0A3S9MYG9_9FLAO|nr:histidine kinase dimerization/phosphoacceptor domain -containing protein [Nonlabens ponticola]AZQ44093.1 tetratricopeptide repeat protein [Nonlabens ponticola]